MKLIWAFYRNLCHKTNFFQALPSYKQSWLLQDYYYPNPIRARSQKHTNKILKLFYFCFPEFCVLQESYDHHLSWTPSPYSQAVFVGEWTPSPYSQAVFVGEWTPSPYPYSQAVFVAEWTPNPYSQAVFVAEWTPSPYSQAVFVGEWTPSPICGRNSSR